MKLLVFSDSHATLRLMRKAIACVKPDWVAHLGDFYEDAEALAEEFPKIPFYMVPGNCDKYRSGGLQPGILCPSFGGVRFYMTHGHDHRVKLTRSMLVSDAQKAGAQVALLFHMILLYTALFLRKNNGGERKGALQQNLVEPGEVTLTFTIANESGTDAQNLYLSSLDGLLSESIGQIDAGSSQTFVRQHSVTPSELDSGEIVYVVSHNDPIRDDGKVNYTVRAAITRSEINPQAEFTRQFSSKTVSAIPAMWCSIPCASAMSWVISLAGSNVWR